MKPLYVLLLWNLITFIQFGLDKYFAIKRKRRISEASLLMFAFLLGGVGSFLSMYSFRHKTKHIKFKILIPLAALITLAATYFILGGNTYF